MGKKLAKRTKKFGAKHLGKMIAQRKQTQKRRKMFDQTHNKRKNKQKAGLFYLHFIFLVVSQPIVDEDDVQKKACFSFFLSPTSPFIIIHSIERTTFSRYVW